MKDLYNNSTVKALLSAQRYESITTGIETGTAVDLKGEGRKCLVLVNVGATSTATMSIQIQESTDNSTFTSLGSAIVRKTTGLTVVDLTPTKRYIRAVATQSETATVANACYVELSVEAIIYNERYRPSNVA